MAWKKLPKTKVAELLGVHRNTIPNLLSRGELKGLTVPDVVEYVRNQGAADRLAKAKAKVLEVLDTL